MEFHKRLNLLPQSYKDRYINKYLMFTFGSITAVLILIMLTSLVSLALITHSINKLTAENKEYQSRQATISSLQESVGKKQKLIAEYEKDNFPFHAFINAVTEQKPEGLTIISIDSADRLISVDKNESTESTVLPKQQETDKEKELNPTSSPTAAKQVVYEKDLAGSKLIVRGYSTDSATIASFVSNLSRLFYVADAELKAIEEHTINGTDKANVFEVVLQLK